ncbi:hypothetical protein ACFOEZ_20305 [Tianweitania populi]|uniref:Uncharacterized protein n=1 Tax=Tianweitania populi TaxID=1607949 RepID=A0A8J3DX07_9HYPH|nr:hypothetical protein [Tianweitania populi]GHD20971.1 hypothetical protein GCM10016234_34120 [Tianweitania populi]
MEKKFHDRKSGIAQSHQLARAFKVDMREWFETTAESCFSHINRSSIQAAVSEVRGREYAASVAGMKKAEAAAFAERAVKVAVGSRL